MISTTNDIAAFIENMEFIEQAHEPYVVIAPSYMIYTMDYSQLLESHIESGADITLLYHAVDNAKESFLNCNILNLNKQKGVLSMEPNHGNAKNRNIFMETYVMKKDLFIELVEKAHKLSSMYTLSDIVNDACNSELDIRGIAHRGYFASISDFKSYYDANISLIDMKTCQSLFSDGWTIYTRTNDSCPTQYFENASAKNSVVSNGCHIEGTVENSVIGRGCVIKEGAVVKNSVILPDSVIGKDVYVENQVVGQTCQTDPCKRDHFRTGSSRLYQEKRYLIKILYLYLKGPDISQKIVKHPVLFFFSGFWV